MKRLSRNITRYLLPLLILAGLWVLPGCKATPAKTETTSGTRGLTTPTPPGLMQDPEERVKYVLDNFWKELCDTSGKYLCDSLHIAGVQNETVESQVGLYATLLLQVSPDVARTTLRRMVSLLETAQLADTSSNILKGMDGLLFRYLYDPNSPVRNEDAYGAYASALSESRLVPPAKKSTLRTEAHLCSLNATGTVAADFSILCRDGKTRTLHGTRSPLTLLFFSNPGCNNCAEITALLSTDDLATRLQADGTLRIVNVYIDEEIDKWWEYSSQYPEGWICGFDPDGTIRRELLYNVRAIPSLYLLDEDKKVLLKDTTSDRLMQYLYSLASSIYNSNLQ